MEDEDMDCYGFSAYCCPCIIIIDPDIIIDNKSLGYIYPRLSPRYYSYFSTYYSN